eukprot:6191748-Prymnesium_polylepis.1
MAIYLPALPHKSTTARNMNGAGHTGGLASTLWASSSSPARCQASRDTEVDAHKEGVLPGTSQLQQHTALRRVSQGSSLCHTQLAGEH